MKKPIQPMLCFALILLLSLNLTSCAKDEKKRKKAEVAPTATVSINTAVINTVASDYSDANMQLVDLNKGILSGNLTANIGSYSTNLSDYGLAAYGENFYRIGRYFNDTVAKYSISNPNTKLYEFSTLDNVSDPSSNPYQLVFVSETKAYLIRYNTNKVWIVNPSASTQATFKIGEIDLSAYNDADISGSIEMSDAVIANGKLFITLQRQNAFAVINGNSYLAVIDTATDTEINTTAISSPAIRGIQLKTNNPLSITFDKVDGLFVQSTGDYGFNSPFIIGYIGGIEKINMTDYSTTILVDDGDSTTHPYGLITNMAIISPTLGYFVGYEAYGDNSVYQFNPSTGVVAAGNVANLGANTLPDDIRNINAGPSNSLWVSLADLANPRVLVINTANNQIVDQIETTYNPVGVVFAAK